jgi:predicted transposase/invertase (TIGR01784 family)
MAIIRKQGFKLPIVQNCDILKEYCKFMEMVLSTEASLKPESTKEDAIVCLEEVIRECIKEGILIDYLTRKGTEVINMFLDEYDYDTDIAVQREEAWKKGNEQGLQQGIVQGAQQQAIQAAINLLKMGKLTPEQIAQTQGLSLEKVLELQQQLKKK